MYVTGGQARPEGALCDRCNLRDCPFVPGIGPDKADLVVVGEAPGDTEVRRGEPFVGRAGMLLNQVLQEASIEREKCYITNACCCRPLPHRAPRKDEIECCRNRLFKEIASRRPKVILALGNAALKALTYRNGISNWLGATIYVDELSAVVVPSYHPAAVLRSPRLYAVLLRDVKKAVTLLQEGYRIETAVRDVDYTVAATLEQINEIVSSLTPGEEVAIDVETGSDGSLLCVGLCWNPGKPVIIPAETLRNEKVREALNEFFGRAKLVGHNLKFDIQVLWRHGYHAARTGADTMLEHYTMNEIPGTHGLKQLAREFLNVPEYDEAVKPYMRIGLEKCPREVLYEYNAKDTNYTLQLHRLFLSMLDFDNLRVLNNLLYPASDVLARMEYVGIMVDIPLLNQLREQLTKEMEVILQELHKAAGKKFNPDSFKQVIQVLYTDLELPIPGRLSADKDALKQIAEYHPIVNFLLQYRATKKQLTTYVEALLKAADENHRVHTTFNLHGTVTGRLSSSNPLNLQNIPKKDKSNVRDVFIATPGYTLIEGDLSQAEVRGLAYYSRDPNLIDTIVSGVDMHTRTACLMFKTTPENVTPEMRQAAKRLTFGVIYQMTAESLAHELNVSITEAEDLIERFFAAYPKAREWIHDIQEEVLRTGRVKTPFGRVRRFGFISEENKGEVMRQAVNAPIQSLASDVTLTALIKAGRILENSSDTRLLLTVHDSILLETKHDDPREVALWLKSVMSEPVLDGVVPFVADVKMGPRWGSMEEIK